LLDLLLSLFIQRGSVAFWMPHVLLRTLPEVGKRRRVFWEREPHDELIVRLCAKKSFKPYAKPSVCKVGWSIAEVTARPLSA
jgi:hypothetical protein